MSVSKDMIALHKITVQVMRFAISSVGIESTDSIGYKFMIAWNVLNTEAVAQLANHEFCIAFSFPIERKTLNGESDVRFAKTNI